VRAGALRNLKTGGNLEPFQSALQSPDPFLQLAARVGLEHSLSVAQLVELTRDPNPALKLQALLTLRTLDPTAAAKVLPALLRQADPQIRLAAIEWFVTEPAPGPELAADMLAGAEAGPLTDRLFGAYLLAMAKLHNTKEALVGERPDPKLCARLAFEDRLPQAFRAMALRWVDPRSPELTDERINGLLSAANPALRTEAVRILVGRATEADVQRLAQLAADPDQPPAIRAEAVSVLDPAQPDQRQLLVKLISQADAMVARQAARSLRGLEFTAAERGALEQAKLIELVERGASSLDISALEATKLTQPGDAAEGERIFFHPRGPRCAECHQVAGRGKRIGPDLTGLGESTSEERLLQSILEPSREIAPQFTLWHVERRDGTSIEGLLESDGNDNQVYRQADGKNIMVPTKDVEARTPLTTSLMPDNLTRLMTAQELRDLIAYLKSAGTVAGEAGNPTRNSP